MAESTNSFGAWLRRSRELRALTLDEVVLETRLPLKVAVALEENDTSVMPDRSYALQYVRSVALAIGLDAEDAALRYEEWLLSLPQPTLPPPQPEASSAPQRALAILGKLWRAPRKLSRDPMVWTVILGTVLVCAFLLWKR